MHATEIRKKEMTHQVFLEKLWPLQVLGFWMPKPWRHPFACTDKESPIVHSSACFCGCLQILHGNAAAYFRASKTPLASGNNLGSSLVVYISHLHYQSATDPTAQIQVGVVVTSKCSPSLTQYSTSVTGTAFPPEWPQCVVKVEHYQLRQFMSFRNHSCSLRQGSVSAHS